MVEFIVIWVVFALGVYYSINLASQLESILTWETKLEPSYFLSWACKLVFLAVCLYAALQGMILINVLVAVTGYLANYQIDLYSASAEAYRSLSDENEELREKLGKSV
jgi:hypothetical protein